MEKLEGRAASIRAGRGGGPFQTLGTWGRTFRKDSTSNI